MDRVLKISVVMCTYNGVRHLQEQLQTVLEQTYPVHEIVVQDDGSTDGTWEWLETFAAGHPQVRLLRNDGPHGINPNFFSAMWQATGDYLAPCDQDDLWEPRKLELQAAAIGDALICSGYSVPFSDEGFPVTRDRRRPNFHLLRVAYIGALPGHTFLMRRELLDFLPDGEQCPYLYDWQLQLIAAAAGRIVFVDDVLVHFRRHAGAATAYKPTEGKLSALRFVATTLFRHPELQARVRKRFAVVEKMLLPLPFHTPQRDDCLEMARLQQGRGLLNFVRRTRFFVRHREHLFYGKESRSSFITWLRALYFPFACGWYYRRR
jgi:glycosyltransferase involved in cell wall biosynthesis